MVKIFGSYHGHSDTTMVSIGVDYEEIGPDEAPNSLPWGAGIPAATVEQVHTVHFNDAGGDGAADRSAGAGVRGHGGRDDQRGPGAPRSRAIWRPFGRSRGAPAWS